MGTPVTAPNGPAAFGGLGGGGAADPPPGLTGEQQQRMRLALIAMGIMGGASAVGAALSPFLLTHSPLALLALSPVGRNLLMVAAVVHPLGLYLVALPRRLAFYAASYQLGKALGPWAIPWLEARAPRAAGYFRFIERLFGMAPHWILLLMSGPITSGLSGASGMRLRVFLPIATASLALRLAIVYAFADYTRVYLDIVYDWIAHWWIEATLFTCALALGQHLFSRWRSARRRSALAVDGDEIP